jgi:GNAT superfamily N-acetyltransferase
VKPISICNTLQFGPRRAQFDTASLRCRGVPGPPDASDPVVAAVPAELTRPLRQSVLRPGRPAEESVFPGDDDPRTVHVAARLAPGGEVVAVGTLLAEAPPWPVPDQVGARSWRIRGMATHPDARGRGIGAAVLAELLRRAEAGGGALVWCNARVPALSFYARAGFTPVGAPFEAPGIGPHQAMQRFTGPG